MKRITEPFLTAKHHQFLQAHGISPAVFEARGCASVTSRTDASMGPQGVRYWGYGKRHTVCHGLYHPEGRHGLVFPTYRTVDPIQTASRIGRGKALNNIYAVANLIRLDQPTMLRGVMTRWFQPHHTRIFGGALPMDVHPDLHHAMPDPDRLVVYCDSILTADSIYTQAEAMGMSVLPATLLDGHNPISNGGILTQQDRSIIMGRKVAVWWSNSPDGDAVVALLKVNGVTTTAATSMAELKAFA